MGTNSTLAKQSIELSVEIVGFYKWLTYEKKEFVMSKQVLRSGTSIGSNIHEAYYAISRPDFIAKMQIALKEAAETQYWLILLERTGYWDEKFQSIKLRNTDIKRMLIATLNTSKQEKTKN
ncbi:four helix bundle protein [Bengtsoniella intestinalis]|uniref:four helix bundle protein n=1 Tax=Bengtsoniella intestinalis TaxID=3073143 RepID=UPI00391F12E3